MASAHNAMRAGIINLVQENSSLMNLINGNIYARSLADLMDPEDIENWDFPLITFRVSGSASMTAITPPHRVSLTIQCWSRDDYDEAWDVAGQLEDVLDNQRTVVDDIVCRFTIINSGQEAFDPTGTLYYVVQQYTAYVLDS